DAHCPLRLRPWSSRCPENSVTALGTIAAFPVYGRSRNSPPKACFVMLFPAFSGRAGLAQGLPKHLQRVSRATLCWRARKLVIRGASDPVANTKRHTSYQQTPRGLLSAFRVLRLFP